MTSLIVVSDCTWCQYLGTEYCCPASPFEHRRAEMHALDTPHNETPQNGHREWDRRLCSLSMELWCFSYIISFFRLETLQLVFIMPNAILEFKYS